MPEFTIRPAVDDDIPVMRDLERNAAQAFRKIGYDFCADGEVRDAAEHKRGMNDGAVFIAETNADEAMGFILLWPLDGHAHIAEVSVATRFQKLGLGRALVEKGEAWASAAGFEAITLTTFRDVAWNAPFYRSLAYDEYTPSPDDADLAAVIDTETELGFDAKPRIVMKKHLQQSE